MAIFEKSDLANSKRRAENPGESRGHSAIFGCLATVPIRHPSLHIRREQAYSTKSKMSIHSGNARKRTIQHGRTPQNMAESAPLFRPKLSDTLYLIL
jgi:hypothetical protein